MKKLLATILALVMALGLCTLGWAAEVVYVAKIGEAKYESLQEAVNAAKDGDTITMLRNASGGVYFGYNADNTDWPKNVTKTITVDFAGTTYDATPTVGSTNTKTNGFQLLKGNTVTLKGGTIQSTQAKILIQNYCNLTLENMNLVGNGETVVSVNCGVVNITGSTNITADGSNAALDISWWPGAYPEGGQATLNTTGTLSGKITLGVFGNSKNGTNIPLTDEQKTDVKSKLTISNATVVGAIESLTWGGQWSSGCNDEEIAAITEKMCSITGGTFSSNPSIYVHDTNYRVVKESDAKYVVAAKGDNTTSDVVLPAASNGATVIPKNDVDANKGLVVKSDTATVEFNQAAVSSIGMADAETTLTVENITESAGTASSETKAAYDKAVAGKDKSSVLVLEMNLKQGNEIIPYIPGDGGAVIVTVPYKTNQKNVQVFYLNTVEGKAEELTKVDGPALSANQFYYNSTTGEVTMMLPHFSSYLIASDSQSSSNYYYKTPTTTTNETTKGSPKTFDAGVGIYAVTALLSVTGMAWAGKKRH